MSTEIADDDFRAMLQGLDQDALREALAGAAGLRDLVRWTASRSRAITGCTGYAARKALVRFDLEEAGGRRCHVDLALKHFAGWNGGGEEAAYRWLASVHGPVPRLAGTFRDAAGDQVLLIELLPHVGYDVEDDSDVEAMLTALARLNASPLPPDGVLGEAPRTPAMLVSRIAESFPRVLDEGGAGLLGPEVRELVVDSAPLWPTLPRHLEQLAGDLAGLPVGVIHGDARPDNAGWRSDRREVLLFDLHKLHRGGIVSDLVLVVGAPGDARQDRLARHWISELRRADGPTLDEATVARARSAAGRLQAMLLLGWQRERAIDGVVDWTPDREEGRRRYRGWLAGTLSGLRDDLASGTPTPRA